MFEVGEKARKCWFCGDHLPLNAYFLFTAIFLVACGSEDVGFGEDDSGKTITLAVGEQIQVTLESNPTTGYQWELDEIDLSVIKQQGEVSYKATHNVYVVGSGGDETFIFEAVGAGETTLTLIYHQPWEEAEPVDTFFITVVVE